MKPPIIPTELEELTERKTTLSEGQEFEAKRFSDCTFEGKTSVIKFEGVVLQKCNLTATHVKRFELTDVTAHDCLLFGANWDGVSMHRIEFDKSMMSGIVLSDALAKNIIFKNCKLDLSNFRFSKFQGVKFIDCYLKEADFMGANLKGVMFENCDLDEAEFSGANLDKTDFRTSKIAGMKGTASMKGAIIDTTQLIDLSFPLARDIGIKIMD